MPSLRGQRRSPAPPVRYAGFMETASREAGGTAIRFRSVLGRRACALAAGPSLAGVSGLLGWFGNDGAMANVGVGLFCAAVVVVAWALTSARYAVYDAKLVLRRHFRQREIPLGDILGVSRIAYRLTWRDPMPDDFALGTHVLKLSVRGGAPAIVSPRNEARFLAAIGRDAPEAVAPALDLPR